MKRIDGNKLRAWRRGQQLSLEAMARELGISYVTLQRWETGKVKGGTSELGYQALVKRGYVDA